MRKTVAHDVVGEIILASHFADAGALHVHFVHLLSLIFDFSAADWKIAIDESLPDSSIA
jgi:hypothetical protein